MSRVTRAVVLVTSLLVFLGTTVWAVVNFPNAEDGLRWVPLCIALLVTVPLTFLLKALEYDAAARVLDQRPSMLASFEIAVLAAAANLLPVPGSVIVMVRSLSEGGATYARATAAYAAVGFTWVGTSCVLAGTAFLVAGAWVVGSTALIVGALVLAGSWRTVRSQVVGTRSRSVFLRIVAIETGFVVVVAAQLLLVCAALDIDATITQTVALTLAGTLSTVVGVFPSGLGIRELLTAALSPLVGLSAEQGLVVAVVDRLLWVSMMAVMAGVVLVGRRAHARRHGGTPASVPR